MKYMVLDSKRLLDRYVTNSSTTIIFKEPIQDLAIKEVEDEDNLQLSSKFCQSQLLKPKRREDNLIVLSCVEKNPEVVWGKERQID